MVSAEGRGAKEVVAGDKADGAAVGDQEPPCLCLCLCLSPSRVPQDENISLGEGELVLAGGSVVVESHQLGPLLPVRSDHVEHVRL